jgi:hypothetical protein
LATLSERLSSSIFWATRRRLHGSLRAWQGCSLPLSSWMFVRLCTAASASLPRVPTRRPLATTFQRLALASSVSASEQQQHLWQHATDHVLDSDSARVHMPKRSRSASNQNDPGYMKSRGAPLPGSRRGGYKKIKSAKPDLPHLEPPILHNEDSIRHQFSDLDIRPQWNPSSAKSVISNYSSALGLEPKYSSGRGKIGNSKVYR